jgi:hypothetical protein
MKQPYDQIYDCRPPTALLSKFGPCGLFFLFPKLKSTLKGRRLQTIEELEENSLRDPRALPQNAFQNWKKKLEGSTLKDTSLIKL